MEHAKRAFPVGVAAAKAAADRPTSVRFESGPSHAAPSFEGYCTFRVGLRVGVKIRSGFRARARGRVGVGVGARVRVRVGASTSQE